MQGGLLLSFTMHNFKHRSFQTRTTRAANSCCFLFYLTTMQVLDWSQRIQPQHRQHSSAPSLGQPSGSEAVFGPSCLRGKESHHSAAEASYSVLCDLWDELLGSWQGSSALLPDPLVGTWEGWTATRALRLYSAVCYKHITGLVEPLVELFISISTLLRLLPGLLFLWTGFWSITFLLNCFLDFEVLQGRMQNPISWKSQCIFQQKKESFWIFKQSGIECFTLAIALLK